MLFLRAYDNAGVVKDVISLKANEFVRFLDKSTGSIRVEIGEQGRVVPNSSEVMLDSNKMTALDLKSNEYVKIEDRVTGAIRMERGEKLVFLGKHEEFIGNKEQAVNLKCNEWIKIEDALTGAIRTEKGEKLVFLDKMEAFVGNAKHKAIDVNDETAVLVMNNRTSQQRLITENQAFVPGDDEDVVKEVKLTKLAEYEACIVRDVNGTDKYYYGKNEEERAFFLPPYSEFVTLLWSRGRRRERRDLNIIKLDLRPQYMSFEFNVRTADNVELVLEGSFFWHVVNVVEMAKFTADTTGDVCNHARSKFIEKVSRVTL